MENQNEKKISKAAALHYDMDEGGAPKIVASGSGETAEKIIEKAKENNVPVVKDDALAQVLTKLTLGDEIPSELYNVVAEIFLFIFSMDKDYGDLHEKK